MGKEDNSIRQWAILSGIAIQMGVIIYLFVQLGKWLDENYTENGKGYLILCTLLGVFISLFLVIKQTKNLNSK